MNQKVIKKVLMCKPLYFSTLNYVINPWMQPGTISQKKAMQQWESLVKIYQDLGIQVEVIEQVKGLPDMVFATDEGLTMGDEVLVSRFRFKERQGETPHYEQWFKDHGYKIKKLPDDLYFEGNGTMYFWNDKLFVGLGYRTDRQMCKFLQELFPQELIELHVTAPAFYHLDIAFFPVDNDTIFYYPEAYREEDREALKRLVPNLIPFSEREMEGFCANSVITGKHIIHQKGNPSFQRKIQELGYESIEVDLGEFKKSGGGAHCLTNILETA